MTLRSNQIRSCHKFKIMESPDWCPLDDLEHSADDDLKLSSTDGTSEEGSSDDEDREVDPQTDTSR